jgi:hypothetical protein
MAKAAGISVSSVQRIVLPAPYRNELIGHFGRYRACYEVLHALRPAWRRCVGSALHRVCFGKTGAFLHAIADAVVPAQWTREGIAGA